MDKEGRLRVEQLRDMELEVVNMVVVKVNLVLLFCMLEYGEKVYTLY